jgi:multidrug efflux pump
MKITDYFIIHPVTAIILNCMIIIIGIICYTSLTIREYPNIIIPTITVRTHYQGASAELIELSITKMLEDGLSSIKDLKLIDSTSKNEQSVIRLNFNNNSSIDKAVASIQEILNNSRNKLPENASTPIIERKVGDGSPFILISLRSDNMNMADLTHYANMHFKNIFNTIRGIARTEIWGEYYNYQIKLDAQKMYELKIDASDVFSSIKNMPIALPIGKYHDKIPMSLNIKYEDLDDYRNLIIKSHVKNNKSTIYLKNIADLNLVKDDKDFRLRVNSIPSVAIALYKENDANSLEISNNVQNLLESLKENIPQYINMEIVLDSSEFIRYSLNNILSSIFEAIILVIIIIFIFLGNIRTILIPLVTIPISIAGSFILLKIFGFSINLMTLLAIVLSVGLVVDDAIIVLENIHRYLQKGLSINDAILKGAGTICFSIIAMTLTLATVYAPFLFMTGTVSDLFKEFAVALSGSIIISGIVALTLSPIMCKMTLIDNKEYSFHKKFNHFFESLNLQYSILLQKTINYKKSAIFILLASVIVSILLIKSIKHEMVPAEDRAIINLYSQNYNGQTLDSLNDKINLIESNLSSVDEKKNILSFIYENIGETYFVLLLKPMNQQGRSN